jgi:spermidine synthase
VRALRILYPLFLLSGFCGLIYESIWASYLKLFLGHAAYAQAVVLVVFIGGMAIGAWLCGRFAYRFRNPLAAYAIAEFAIGAAAMLFHRIFVGATDWAYGSLLPAACSGEGLCYASWGFAALLILPQSILLGTTFPLMAAGIMRKVPEAAGRIIATLYFVNSLGAVFGVLAATFILVPAIGLPGASLTAGLLNVLLAGAVFLYARSSVPPPPVAAPLVTGTRAGSTPATTLLVVALLTGLTSFVYEVVWIRMLSLVLGASTHAFEIMLASFILGLALGGAWIRGRIDRLADSRRFLANVQIAMGLLAVSTLALYNQMYEIMAWLLRTLARNDSGYVLFNVGSSVIAMIIMLPATLMAGMTLPLITQLLMRTHEGERSIGKVYGWNTFGGILGVLLAVHLGLPNLGLKMSLGAAALVDVAIGAYLLMGAASAGRWPRPAVAAAALVAFALTFASADIDPHRMIASVYRTGVARAASIVKVLYVGDGKTSTITVFQTPQGMRSIQTNAKVEASVDMSRTVATPDEHTQTLVAALPFAFAPGIRDVAIIGHGSGMTTSAVLAQPRLRRVETIEIEPAMVAGAALFRPVVEAAFTDPRSHIVYDDARSYLARSGNRYDLIISEPSNPWVSGVASLFTQEFYGHMKQSLRRDGMLVQWIQAYETNGRTVASILRALGAVFGDFEVYRSEADLVVVARANGRIGALDPQLFGKSASGRCWGR